MQEQDVQELTQMRGAPIVSNDGEQIGEVEEIFVDNETGKPEWVSLTTGMFGTKHALVPLEGADVQENAISVPYAADQVKDSPKVDAEEISQEQEQEIYAHYGLSYGERRSESGLPEGTPSGASTDDTEFVRSEEELSVDKQQVEAGTARLHKWVETEPVTADVELQREAARVTREPINETVTDADIGEQDVEVPLSAEQATVQKQTVAKERIGLDKEVETETQTVSDDVRKERVEIDGENIEAR